MKELMAGVLDGRARAIARLLTLVENSESAAETAVTALYPHTGQAHIIGITGPPGCGKSTLVNEIAKQLRRQNQRVGILAVDPSSPFTGGALLGDRVRMRDLAGDRGVFIRSMASRGSLGGLAQATWAAIKVLDAAGYEKVLVETVGAGQAEVDIARAAHTTLVVEATGMGDDVQAFKAGILEIADILVVNKADRPGSERVIRSLELMLHLGPMGGMRHHGRVLDTPAPAANGASGGWQIPVLPTAASEGRGIPELTGQIQQHLAYLQTSGEWQKREQERCHHELRQLLQMRFLAQFDTTISEDERDALVTAVAAREMDPYTAVRQLYNQLFPEVTLN
ncbi:MAG TPA: methylmalonyl Co-A mutase-associated GTPase MeaB [Chloroflexota bacterium]|nr:methylmalonyl Co-A mutase-associated GTPase MeaB [Chloroflexota bacterium]